MCELKVQFRYGVLRRQDLWEAIEAGNYPEYELGIQVVEEADEHKFPFDLLDATKMIPEELVPVQVGTLVSFRFC